MSRQATSSPLLFLAALATVLLVGGLIIFKVQGAPTIKLTRASIAQRPTSGNIGALLASSFSFFAGHPNAKVTVTEFFDFQCPYSKEVAPTLIQLMQLYDPSQVKFVFRHFPIRETHPYALAAAQVSVCAKEQNKFMDLYTLFFKNQDAITPDSFFDFSDAAGLDRAKAEECIANQRYQEFILKDLSDGRAIGLNGTPTVFVNDERIEGAQDLSVFREAIDRHLKKK